MITLNNIRYIIFAFIVLGFFANFAQEEYGMAIVNWCALLLAFTFVGNLAQLGAEQWKNKIVARMIKYTVYTTAVAALWLYYGPSDIFGLPFIILVIALILELFIVAIANRKNHVDGLRWTFISFGLFLAFLALFFKAMHWPLANSMLITGGLTSFIPLFQMSIKSFFGEFKNGRVVSFTYLLFLLNIAIGIIATVFKNLHWSGAILIFVFEGFLLLLFLIPLALRVKFKYGNEKMTVAGYLKTKNPNLIFLFIYFNFGALLITMYYFDVGPKFYTLARPPVLEKMIEESPGGNGTAQSIKYQKNYNNFIDDYWALQGK